jgi:hypothetical protein
MKLLLTITLALALCFASGCVNIAGDWHYEEIGRVKSPDGVVDAILARGSAGATTGFNFSVFLAPSGTTFDEKSPFFERERALFSADHHQGLQLVWSEPRLLELRYESARILHFSNFWHSQDVQQDQYVVELKLVPLAEPYALPLADKWPRVSR